MDSFLNDQPALSTFEEGLADPLMNRTNDDFMDFNSCALGNMIPSGSSGDVEFLTYRGMFKKNGIMKGK